MKKLQQVSDIINKCVSYIGMVIFIVLIVACVAQVFFRFILNNSLSWSENLPVLFYLDAYAGRFLVD